MSQNTAAASPRGHVARITLQRQTFKRPPGANSGARATASAGTSGPNNNYAYCLGVVDEASATAASTIRSQAAGTPLYAPNSRCGWRVTSTTAHVELKFTELAIENGFDFVRIYAGSSAPTGFSLTDPATEPRPPQAPIRSIPTRTTTA